MDKTRWLSTEEAARELGFVSSRYLRKQIELGRLPATVLLSSGRTTYRIAEGDLEAFLDTYTVSPPGRRKG